MQNEPIVTSYFLEMVCEAKETIDSSQKGKVFGAFMAIVGLPSQIVVVFISHGRLNTEDMVPGFLGVWGAMWWLVSMLKIKFAQMSIRRIEKALNRNGLVLTDGPVRIQKP